jgi:hypothetical protein
MDARIVIDVMLGILGAVVVIKIAPRIWHAIKSEMYISDDWQKPGTRMVAGILIALCSVLAILVIYGLAAVYGLVAAP